MEWARDEFTITCDRSRVDLGVVSRFLADSYWAKDIPVETVAKSIEGALCFSLLHDGKQVGFARVVTDHAVIAYLADVFVLPEYRGRGLGKWLVKCVVSHPDLAGLKRWMLATRDAHGLYEPYGFRGLKAPERFMELHDPDVYSRAK